LEERAQSKENADAVAAFFKAQQTKKAKL